MQLRVMLEENWYMENKYSKRKNKLHLFTEITSQQ